MGVREPRRPVAEHDGPQGIVCNDIVSYLGPDLRVRVSASHDGLVRDTRNHILGT